MEPNSDWLKEEISNGKKPTNDDLGPPDAIGVTMFDTSGSKDNRVTVLVRKEHLMKLPSQALVEIVPRTIDGVPQGKRYHGVVVEGPFYQPDGLRPDEPIIVTTALKNLTFVPQYHGRVLVEVIAELDGDTPGPPRFRPMPNSHVRVMDEAATRKALDLKGDMTLGLAIGHENLEVKLPSDKKSVLPRHLGIIGTTGGGKSTTVSGLMHHFQQSGIATVVIDTEGEYTRIDEPTDREEMIKLLAARGNRVPEGVKNTHIAHPVGRETTNPNHERRQEFSIPFEQISPYAVMEIIGLNDAQQQRFLKAYDVARGMLQTMKIFPVTKEDRERREKVDDMETGYPHLTLAFMYDVIRGLATRVAKEFPSSGEKLEYRLFSPAMTGKEDAYIRSINGAGKIDHPASWRTLQGKLGRLLRLGIFDNPEATALDFEAMTAPGKVTIIDLSDTESPQVNNLVIAELLRGMLEAQNRNYKRTQKANTEQNKVMIVIEEAHEFLSAQRIRQMPVLYQQVARIARRGRKRWLGLAFVTQLPQHLPDEVLTLINSFILHKIGDANVINRLKRSIGGVDDSLWRKLTSLSAGQAIVSAPSLKRAMLVAIDPTPCYLRMAD